MKTQSVRKTDVRVKKTFDKLLTAFFELIRITPYEEITVIDICNRAQVHRATFYKHFIDKQDFVNFCFSEKLESLRLDSDAFIFGSNDLDRNENAETVKKIIDFVYENRHIIADLNLSNSSSAFSGALVNAIADVFEKRINHLSKTEMNIVSPVPMLAHYYAGAIVEVLKWWSLQGLEYGKEDIFKFVMTRFVEVEYTTKSNRQSAKI